MTPPYGYVLSRGSLPEPATSPCCQIVPAANDDDYLFISIVGTLDDRPVEPLIEKIESARRIKVWLDSPGGSYYAGSRIHSALAAHQDTTCFVVNRAWSAAVRIMVGCKRIIMHRQASLMVHSPHCVFPADPSALGSINMADQTRALDASCEETVSVLRARIPNVAEFMNGASKLWFADEALSLGIVDQIL